MLGETVLEEVGTERNAGNAIQKSKFLRQCIKNCRSRGMLEVKVLGEVNVGGNFRASCNYLFMLIVYCYVINVIRCTKLIRKYLEKRYLRNELINYLSNISLEN